ncbi:COX18 [Branchiostoma lanceolatum]|uniref:COX18 protein n=3 Tax=Branchiostoma lanceolatum TaxID=7740 RepID=A0A8K0EBT6_BRALA|nr:COX18 [Branchiostoma lanceolatum]
MMFATLVRKSSVIQVLTPMSRLWGRPSCRHVATSRLQVSFRTFLLRSPTHPLSQGASCLPACRQSSAEPMNFHLRNMRPQQASAEPVNFHLRNMRPQQASAEPVNFHLRNMRPQQASAEPMNFHLRNMRPQQASAEPTNFHLCNMRPQQASILPRIFSRNRTFLPITLPCLTPQDVSGLVAKRHVSTETAAPPSGWYADMFGPESAPVRAAMTLLEQVHLHTGLPWWATIAMTTVALRLGLTFPLAVYQAHVIARVETLQPELARFAAELRRRVAIAGQQRGWTEKQMRAKFNVKMREFRTSLFIRDNCHPFKGSLLVWVQLPLFICVSFALRHMTGTFQGPQGAASPVLQPDMASQGALWFTDLTAADPTLLLPVLLGTLNLLIVEMHSLQQTEKTRTQKVVTNFFRGVSVVMVMVAAYMPAAMTLYWTSSSAVGLAQNILLKLPRLRKACRIPPTPRDSPTPFRDMAATARQKLRREGKPPGKS